MAHAASPQRCTTTATIPPLKCPPDTRTRPPLFPARWLICMSPRPAHWQDSLSLYKLALWLRPDLCSSAAQPLAPLASRRLACNSASRPACCWCPVWNNFAALRRHSTEPTTIISRPMFYRATRRNLRDPLASSCSGGAPNRPLGAWPRHSQS